jgi:hypothetical protein
MEALDNRYEVASRRRRSGARFGPSCGPATVDATAAVLKRRRRLLKDFSVGQSPRRCRELRAAEPQSRYGSTSCDRPWTTADDDFLRNEWHLLPVEEIARRLGRDVTALNVRRRRLGIRRYDGDELTLRALQRFTGLSERRWRDLFDRGWLQVRMRVRCGGTKLVRCVTVDGVRSLLKRHPEVLDYRVASRVARFRMELDSLPAPPHYKRLRCTSAIAIGLNEPVTQGDAAGAEERALRALDRDWMLSCAEVGGTAFWAAIYSAPVCPRCGSAVSALSPDSTYSDAEPEGLMEKAGRRARTAGFGGRVAATRQRKIKAPPSSTRAVETARVSRPERKEKAPASQQTP